MLDIKRALKQDRLLRAMTGLNLQAFNALLPIFTKVYEKNVLTERTSTLRQRAIGGGRKAKLLAPQDKLFFILFYFKCYPTFDLAGLLFDLDRAQAHRWVHRLQPILEQALGEKKVLPLRQLHKLMCILNAHQQGIGNRQQATVKPLFINRSPWTVPCSLSRHHLQFRCVTA